ncbi:MAG: HAMP domain-containing protein [Desulfobacterales bacterium]|nr:HAMP domain-containing protein [Desulfobacterales bacterium]
MSQNKHLHKRTHYFIKKDFQFKFILKFCLIILAGAFISTGLLFLFSHDTLTSSFQHSRLTIQNTAVAILPAVIYTNLITLGLICMAAIVVILFISHKIAGPIFRFEKEIKEIGQGDLTKRIRLRKKDQITELAESIDNMTASLNEKVLDIQTGLERLLELASKQNAPQGLIEELDRLKQKIEHNFKT